MKTEPRIFFDSPSSLENWLKKSVAELQADDSGLSDDTVETGTSRRKPQIGRKS